jgi:hypothetical protein
MEQSLNRTKIIAQIKRRFTFGQDEEVIDALY